MKFSLVLCILLTILSVRAQDIISSTAGIESCLDQQDCISVNGPSYLFYDESRNEFYLKVDFSQFRSDKDSLNTWIDDMSDSTLYFKANLLKESFPALSNQNTKTLKLNGEVFYNNIIRTTEIEMTLYTTENSIVVSANNNLRYDTYKVNFSVPVAARDYKAYQKIMYVNQTIAVNVTMGRINLLRPGMESQLKEIYFLSTR